MIKTKISVNLDYDYTTTNPFRLIPYVNDAGEIWLASEGNGSGNDMMVEDVEGWTHDDINAKYSGIDLDAMLEAADEIESAGDSENADWLRDWVRTCRDAAKVEG